MKGYPKQAIDYFIEIAIGTQLGQDTLTVHKWTTDILIQVIGKATDEDKDMLDRVATELSDLEGAIRIDFVTSNPTTKLYFAPPSKFARLEPHYVPPSTAFFWSSGMRRRSTRPPYSSPARASPSTRGTITSLPCLPGTSAS